MKSTGFTKFTTYSFKMEHEEKEYKMTICLDSEGRFIDWLAFDSNGDQIRREGEDEDFIQEMVDFLDQNWDSVTAD